MIRNGVPCTGQVINVGGRVSVLHGPFLMFDFADDDIGMRNFVLVSLTKAKVLSGKAAGRLFGVRPEHVARLRSEYVRSGPAGLAPKRAGRPPALAAEQIRQARLWAGRRISHAQIAKRLGVPRSVVTETLKRHGGPITGPDRQVGEVGPGRTRGEPARTGSGGSGSGEGAPGVAWSGGPRPDVGVTVPPAGHRIEQGVFSSRFAGAMLVHAYTHLIGAETLFAKAVAAAPAASMYDDVGVLTAAETVFGLRTSMEEFSRLPARQAGPLIGWEALPALPALRDRLAQIADSVDPVALLTCYFDNFMRVDVNQSSVHYIDDRFAPPAASRSGASGLTTRQDKVGHYSFDTPTTTVREDRAILLGFGRGGVHLEAFSEIRAHRAHWITYRCPPLARTRHLPVIGAVTRAGKTTPLAWADELVRLAGYHNGAENDSGICRQITVFRHGKVAVQILTSDRARCAEALLPEFMDRRGIRNRVEGDYRQYTADLIGDSAFTIVPYEWMILNPARRAADAAVRTASVALDQARADYSALRQDSANLAGTEFQILISRHQHRITVAEQAFQAAQAARDQIPSQIPANGTDPTNVRAIQDISRRLLPVLLRLIAANAERWLSGRLNATLENAEECQSIIGDLIHGHSGTITYSREAIAVALTRPESTHAATAIEALLDQLNTDPPHMPGDPRPITYALAPDQPRRPEPPRTTTRHHGPPAVSATQGHAAARCPTPAGPPTSRL